MSSYMVLWNQAMATRDADVVKLSVMALAIVVTWSLVDLAPVRIQKWLRRVYIGGGLILYAVTVILAFLAVTNG